MKKILSLLMTFALVLSLSVTALAVGLGDQTQPVTATYEDGITRPKVYSVDIEWGSMHFNYTKNGTYTWNPENHTYTESDDAKMTWEPATDGANSIEITNHSNVSIDIDKSFTAAVGYTGVTSKWGGNPSTGLSQYMTDAPSVRYSLMLSGDPGLVEGARDVLIGTVTITIS